MITNNKMFSVAIGATATVLLSACGGSSGGDTAANADPQPLPIVEATSTEDLKRNAANSVGKGLGNSLNGAGAVLNQNNDVIAGTSLDIANGGAGTLDTMAQTDIDVNDSLGELLSSTLALDGDGSRTTRDGNIITINPDPNEICAAEGANAAGTIFNNCVSLVQDLSVRLVAISDDEGSLAYQFDGQPLMTIGYGPIEESFELSLSPFRSLAVRAAQLEGQQINLPETFNGAIKFSSSNQLDASGEPISGSTSIDVTQAIAISDAAQGTSLSFGTGTLFSLDFNAETGSGGMEFDIGAINLLTPDEGALSNISMPGFTARAEVSEATGQLVVSNLGLARGPLRVSIDNQEALSLSMQAFGFTVSEATEDVVLTGAMDIMAFTDQMLTSDSSDEDSFFTDSIFGEFNFVTLVSSTLAATAPAGTSFARAGNGTLQLTAVGPLSFMTTDTFSDGSVESTDILLNAGECLGETEVDPFSFDEPQTAVVSCQ